MSNEQALLHCTFGWGKTCRLYYDSIEIAGKSYNLKDLTSIHPSYRVVFGIPSARLELSFGLDQLILRGIADLDIARLMVSHLQPYCSTAPHVAHKRLRSSRARSLARAQARAWERTQKLPALLDISTGDSPLPRSSGTLDRDERATSSGIPGFDEAMPTDQPISQDAVPRAPIEDTSLTPGETLEAFAQLANNLSTYASPLPTAFWQPPHTPRFQPPLHSVHLIPPHQKFDSGSIPVPAVKSSVLPIIHVPVRLQHGECAHYSIGATLCSDRIASGMRATYPLLDHGLLILTNRRVLYIGKRCRFTLAYTHLWYVSLLHTAIALHIEGQFRRIIIELEHPQEWASRIELLSFIARRSRPEPPTVSVAAVPGLNMTAKRQAVKPASIKKLAVADNTTIPLLSERVASKIVEAETIELSEAAIQACADHKTLDMPPSVPIETLVTDDQSRTQIAEQPTRTDLTLRETSPQSRIENVPTWEFPQQPDREQITTQDCFSPEKASPADAPAENSPSRADLTQMTTREFSQSAEQPQADVTQMTTREFSPPSASDSNHAPEVARASETTREKTTQGLQLAPDEIAKLQAAQPSEPEPEVTTSALYDPAYPLAALVRGEKESAVVSGELLDDDDDRTIHLHDRKLSVLRTVSLRESAAKKLLNPERAERRRRPIHTQQRSS